MKQFYSELRDLARKFQHEVNEFLAHMKQSNESDQAPPIDEMGLGRIEQKIDTIYSHTHTPVSKMSETEGGTLSSVERETENPPFLNPNHHPVPAADPRDTINRLTPQEKRLFNACLQSGPLTYRELSHHLGTSPNSAKNMVNRLYHDADKRRLLRKETSDGIVRVTVSESMNGRIQER